jgi:iron complex outermembrane receptor protein
VLLGSAAASIVVLANEPVIAQQSTEPAPEQQQTRSTIKLDPITVRGPRKRAAPQTAAPVEPAQAPVVQESAYGPVDGYLANQSATATKTDTPLREVPQSVTVVTEDRVKDQGVTTVQEALRYVPGANADAYGPDTRGDYPRVRGSDPNIFIDGMRSIDTYRFNEFRPDPYLYSRIEVLRGPASVLYGDMSTAGLINLVTKLPQAQEFHEIGVQYGSFDRKQIQTDHPG